MYERNGDVARLKFQWVVGDTRALERHMKPLSRGVLHAPILLASNLVAFVSTLVAAGFLLPDAEFVPVALIAFVGCQSLWVASALSIFTLRRLDRLRAQQPWRVGWNYVQIDATGVLWSRETTHEYTSWLGVSEVRSLDGSVWIKTGPIHGFYVPPRVFANSEELSDFLELLAKLRENPTAPLEADGEVVELTRH